MVTADQLALLRATVDGDFERSEELSHALRASGGLDEYGTVIGAAFYIAVHRQFPERYCAEDVIRLVADTRAVLDQTGDVIDPRAAELVVRSALGERGLVSTIPPATVVQVQVAVCSVLADQKKLGDPDDFMREVQALIDEWSN
jgi:hypothetical protein